MGARQASHLSAFSTGVALSPEPPYLPFRVSGPHLSTKEDKALAVLSAIVSQSLPLMVMLSQPFLMVCSLTAKSWKDTAIPQAPT